MVTISQITKQLIRQKMLIREYLSEGIINYIALAEQFRPQIENEMGKKVKATAIAMALRRLGDEVAQKKIQLKFLKNAELTLRGNLVDIVVYKSASIFRKLEKLYSLVDFNRADTLNVVHGNVDVCIIINARYEKKALDLLEGEKIINIEHGLVALRMYMGKEVLHIPGTTYTILKQLVLENINLIEVISSMMELTFIINKADATRGYRALQEFLERL